MKEIFEVAISDDITILTEHLKRGISHLIKNKNQELSFKKDLPISRFHDNGNKRCCDKDFGEVTKQMYHLKQGQPHHAKPAASVEDLIYNTIRSAGFECEQIPRSSLKIPYFSEFRKQHDFHVDLVGHGTPFEMKKKLKDKSLLLSYPFQFREYDDHVEPVQSNEPFLFCSQTAYLPKNEPHMDMYASQKFGQLEVAIIFLQCQHSGQLNKSTSSSGTGKKARVIYQEKSDLKPHPLELLRQPIWAFLSLFMPELDDSIIDNAKQKSYYKLITRPRVRILSYLNRLGVFMFTSRELEEAVKSSQLKIKVRKSVNLMDTSDSLTTLRSDIAQLMDELSKIGQGNKNLGVRIRFRDNDGDIVPVAVTSYADLVKTVANMCGLKPDEILKFQWDDMSFVKDDSALLSTPVDWGQVLTPVLQQNFSA
eukprot:TRINITY_DN2414_c0_g1_i1.p1 TRINITY_DN2414_c0_g1~~TRINITY_DN2414_c0_g1_i1.p1  ORF type:complete len:446 (+),score=44.80 TRINITY_DN2414_c0_g1_i1:70-1338(+)